MIYCNTARSQSTTRAILTCCSYYAIILATNYCTMVEARSWWSLEIPAIEGLRDTYDPLYAASSTLLMEDTSFLYGPYQWLAEEDDDMKNSSPSNFENDAGEVRDPFTTYSTAAPSVYSTVAPISVEIEEGREEEPLPLTSASPVIATPSTTRPTSTTPSSSDNIHSPVTNFPTMPSVQIADPNPASPTASPAVTTTTPSVGPTEQPPPTFSPSERFEAANGSCPSNHALHRLWLFDSAGDGWGSTKLIIQKTGGTTTSTNISSSLKEDNGVVFDGSLDAVIGVVRYAPGVVSTRGVHNKDSRAQVEKEDTIDDPRQLRRRLAMTHAARFANSGHAFASKGNTAPDDAEGVAAESSGGAAGIADSYLSDKNTTTGVDTSLGGSSSMNEWVYLCLSKEDDVCYNAQVSGGKSLEGARWEITRVEMGSGENIGLVAEGVGEGTGSCDFGLDDSCVVTCDGTAQLSPTVSPTVAVLAVSQASSTDAPVDMPTQSPSILRIKKSATTSPTDFLPQDKGFSFVVNAYRQIQDMLLSASPSSEAALADDSSPQSRAFKWIYDNNASGLSERRLVQRWALASFYYGTNGDEWNEKTGWMESGDECQWYGVSCLSGIVSKLELEQNRLVGEIVPEISVWKHTLYALSLGNDYGASEEEKNQFVMPVPSFLGDLTYLSFLNLEGVGMASTIPEDFFSTWPHLKSLYLNDNDITGSLPKSIGDLGSIEVLWLGGNNLGGSIVPEIGELLTLKDLSLESNYREDAAGKRGFITTVPLEIGRLTNLEVLSLADNALSGQVPKLDDLISLRQLRLSGNFFEGQLPPAWGKLEMLEELDLSFNWLSSTIPAEYGNMISLTSLSLQSNYNDKNGYFTWGIKDKLPPELGELKNLQHLNLGNNYLTGTLITEIGQLYQLQTMDLQNNFLEGPIPYEYSNNVYMKDIFLQDNNIDGESYGMPEEICRLPDLELARVDCDVSCSCCLKTC